MHTRMLRRLGTPALTIGLLAGIAAAPAMAAPESSTATPQKYCAVLLTPASATTSAAPKLACSDKSATAAKAALPAAAAASLRLMTAYTDAQYGGPAYNFYGAEYCDADGYNYNLYNYGNLAHTISSIRGYQSCNAVTGGTLDSPVKLFSHNLSWSFGGTAYNDNMRNIHLYSNR